MDGELFVTGRLKDLIIVRGVNRYPQDIERTVEESSERLVNGGAAAFAVEDRRSRAVDRGCETERKRRQRSREVIDAGAAPRDRRTRTAARRDRPGAFGSVPSTSSGKIQRIRLPRGFPGRQSSRSGPLDRLDGLARDTASKAEAPSEPSRNGEAASHRRDPRPESHRGRDATRFVRSPRNVPVHSTWTPTSSWTWDWTPWSESEIATKLEETFGGRFPQDVMAEIETVRDVALAIEEHMATPWSRRPLPTAPSRDLTPDRTITPYPTQYFRFDQMAGDPVLRRQRDQLLSTGATNPYYQRA